MTTWHRVFGILKLRKRPDEAVSDPSPLTAKSGII